MHVDIVLEPYPDDPITSIPMASRFACWHPTMQLGHRRPKRTPLEWIRFRRNMRCIVDMFMRDDLSVTPYEEHGTTWIGWAYIPGETFRNRFRKKTHNAMPWLYMELEAYSNYLSGNVYSVHVTKNDGTQLVFRNYYWKEEALLVAKEYGYASDAANRMLAAGN